MIACPKQANTTQEKRGECSHESEAPPRKRYLACVSRRALGRLRFRQRWRLQRSLVGSGRGPDDTSGGFLWPHLASLSPQSQGNECQPEPSDEKYDSLDQTVHHGEACLISERQTDSGGERYHKDEHSSHPGVGRPPTTPRVGSKASGQDEACSGKHHIHDHCASESVDPAVPGLRGAIEGSTGRISVAGIGHTHSDDDEAQSEQADQQRSPDRGSPCAPDPP